MMLKDRRELIECDLKDLKLTAAALYIDMIRVGATHSIAYEKHRDLISKYEFDLKMINELIEGGHE